MVLCIVKNMHHKAEKKSVENGESFIAQTLAWRGGKRLRKIVCQDLLSQNYSVILVARRPTGLPFQAKNLLVS